LYSDCGQGCFRCDCVLGYEYSGYGSLCSFNINDCNPNPCFNGGTCVDKVNDYECRCNFGYSGKECQTRDDPCLGMSCINGNLRDCGVGCCECDCLAGWDGIACTNDIDECLTDPCRRGSCVDEGPNAYSCDNPSCPTGWTVRESVCVEL
jgi:Notch-like protein